VRELVEWLVAADYKAIELFTGGKRLKAGDLQAAIESYGKRLVSIPSGALGNIDVVDIVGSIPKAWSVRVELWTADEGRSDLSLECTMIDCGCDLLKTEIDNLHVC